ncbi:glycosyltransferase [Aeromonas salmonicida subsp. pectinolytica]
MKEVTIVFPHNRGGGTTNASLSHLIALTKCGWNVNSLIVFGANGVNLSKGVILLNSYFSYLNPVKLISAFISFRKEAKECVVAMHFDAIIFCLFMKKLSLSNSSFYAYFHTNLPTYYSSLRGIKKFLFKKLLLSLSEFNGIIFLTEDQIDWFKKEFPSLSQLECTCIKNPYVEKEFKSVPFSGRTGFIYLGRLSKEKNVGFIIRAFRHYCELGGREVLFIYGAGSEIDSLRKLACDLQVENRVHFCGFVDDPVTVMSRARLLIMASKVEGFPLVILEALNAQLNIITSNCSPAPYELFGVTNRSEEYFGEHISIMDVPNESSCAEKYAREMIRLGKKDGISTCNVHPILAMYSPERICKTWDVFFKKSEL